MVFLAFSMHEKQTSEGIYMFLKQCIYFRERSIEKRLVRSLKTRLDKRDSATLNRNAAVFTCLTTRCVKRKRKIRWECCDRCL